VTVDTVDNRGSIPQRSFNSVKTVGLHAAGNIATETVKQRFRDVIGDDRLLPLPPLAMPAAAEGTSRRSRQRHNLKLASWRSAVFLGSAIGWLYGGTREAKRAPQPLTSMKPHHQHAWRKLLRESAKLCEARRTLPEC